MDLQKYYNEYAGLSSLKKEKLMDAFFEELSPMGYIISDSLGFFRTFLVRGITC